MPHAKNNVYLIGPMGSGKTTIGQRLASLMGLTFHDCDQEIETRTGASVSLIFEIEGEEGFRKRESRMLRELCAMNKVLIATGGGAVISQTNRDLLRKSGLVVYLRTGVDQQLERLGRDRSRPLLQTRNRESKLTALARVRNPLYEEVADIIFPVKNHNINNTVNRLYKIIEKYRCSPAAEPGTTLAAGSDS